MAEAAAEQKRTGIFHPTVSRKCCILSGLQGTTSICWRQIKAKKKKAKEDICVWQIFLTGLLEYTNSGDFQDWLKQSSGA
jgi:hypothetical protein